MIATIVTSVSIIFVVLGALISAFAATGLIRLRDVYSRAHAAGKAATLGAMFLLFGAFLYFIGIIFVFITGPLSSHLIMKAAYNIKTPYTKDTKIDEIKEDMKHTKL